MEERLPPIHPGEVLLEEFMKPLEISQSRLAMDLRVPVQRLHDLVHGKRSVSLDTAMRLSRYFGTSAEVWLNLQARYDLEKAEDEGLSEKIERDVRPREDRYWAEQAQQAEERGDFLGPEESMDFVKSKLGETKLEADK